MEIKDVLKECSILGVVGNYKSTLKLMGKVKDLSVKNISMALKMVNLSDSILDRNLQDLSISEVWKIELATKLDEDIIIIGNMYNSLIHKDREYIKKLFIKLSEEYGKKIVLIDNNMNSFLNFVKKLVVINNKSVIYVTEDLYDEKLYDYIRMPKLIEFINYVNKDSEKVNKTTDIYELLKDIYRRVS